MLLDNVMKKGIILMKKISISIKVFELCLIKSSGCFTLEIGTTGDNFLVDFSFRRSTRESYMLIKFLRASTVIIKVCIRPVPKYFLRSFMDRYPITSKKYLYLEVFITCILV